MPRWSDIRQRSIEEEVGVIPLGLSGRCSAVKHTTFQVSARTSITIWPFFAEMSKSIRTNRVCDSIPVEVCSCQFRSHCPGAYPFDPLISKLIHFVLIHRPVRASKDFHVAEDVAVISKSLSFLRSLKISFSATLLFFSLDFFDQQNLLSWKSSDSCCATMKRLLMTSPVFPSRMNSLCRGIAAKKFLRRWSRDRAAAASFSLCTITMEGCQDHQWSPNTISTPLPATSAFLECQIPTILVCGVTFVVVIYSLHS